MSGPVTRAYEERLARGELAPDAGQRSAAARLDAVLARLAEAPPPNPPARGLAALLRRSPPPAPPVRGLYLWGPVGRGKSMLMDLFHEAAPVAPRRRVHFHAFMQEIHAALHEARRTGVKDAIAPVAERVAASARLLCFDEMQITDITDAMIVGRLFEKLFAAGVVVVTTSNRPPSDLYKDGLNRQLFLPFIAMLEERLELAELGGATDHRQRLGAEERLWFAPPDATATARMAAMWEALGDGPAAPLVLQVAGREVVVPEVRGSVARACFEDLCSRPLGPADYLALARQVRVLFLTGIPRLSRARNNEAKRFVTLIDALYEARCGLVASAEAEPETLYLEGPGAFEFQRTASRLAEMRARSWLETALSRPEA